MGCWSMYCIVQLAGSGGYNGCLQHIVPSGQSCADEERLGVVSGKKQFELRVLIIYIFFRENNTKSKPKDPMNPNPRPSMLATSTWSPASRYDATDERRNVMSSLCK